MWGRLLSFLGSAATHRAPDRAKPRFGPRGSRGPLVGIRTPSCTTVHRGAPASRQHGRREVAPSQARPAYKNSTSTPTDASPTPEASRHHRPEPRPPRRSRHRPPEPRPLRRSRRHRGEKDIALGGWSRTVMDTSCRPHPRSRRSGNLRSSDQLQGPATVTAPRPGRYDQGQPRLMQPFCTLKPTTPQNSEFCGVVGLSVQKG